MYVRPSSSSLISVHNHRYTHKVALSIIDNDQYGEGSPPALETDERHDEGTDCDGAGASDTGTEMEELVPRLPARPRLAGRNSAFGGPARNRVVTGGETPYSSETESSCAAPRGTTKGASCMPRREAHEEREEEAAALRPAGLSAAAGKAVAPAPTSGVLAAGAGHEPSAAAAPPHSSELLPAAANAASAVGARGGRLARGCGVTALKND